MRSLLLAAVVSLVACGGSTAEPNQPSDTGATTDVPDDVGALPRVQSQDVSILFPLSKSLLVADGLLPKEAFAKVAAPLDARKVEADPFAALRVVAIRIDPCFGVKAGETGACKPQIRLVFQQVRDEGAEVTADDGAVHAFYSLTDAELRKLSRQVMALAKLSGGYAQAPLGVHPLLAKEGADGAFGKGLKGVVRDLVNGAKLVRMTFFVRTAARASTWEFGQLDLEGSALVRKPIVGLSSDKATLTASAGPDLAGKRTPAVSTVDDPMLLANFGDASAATAEARATAFGAALRVENPRKHTPDTVDCVSCHSAAPARLLGESKFGLASKGHPDAFPNAAHDGPKTISLENIHAFGWLGKELSVSQRTANEAAVVADAVDALIR